MIHVHLTLIMCVAKIALMACKDELWVLMYRYRLSVCCRSDQDKTAAGRLRTHPLNCLGLSMPLQSSSLEMRDLWGGLSPSHHCLSVPLHLLRWFCTIKGLFSTKIRFAHRFHAPMTSDGTVLRSNWKFGSLFVGDPTTGEVPYNLSLLNNCTVYS